MSKFVGIVGIISQRRKNMASLKRRAILNIPHLIYSAVVAV